MRYRLRSGIFGPGDAVTIHNQHGWQIFVVSRGQTWQDAVVIRDRAGLERATLQRRRLPYGESWFVQRAGRSVAMVVRGRRGLLLTPCFTIRTGEPDEPVATGDFAAHEYVIRRASRTIANVARTGWGIEVSVDPGENQALILAGCIAIDAVALERASVSV